MIDVGPRTRPQSEISLLIPSYKKRFPIPYSVVVGEAGLAKCIDKMLERLARPRGNQAELDSSGALRCPSPGEWVIVDVGNSLIIHREFLKELLLPGGYYMVLSIRASALSEEELVDRVRELNIPRPSISSEPVYKFPVYKFTFPTHRMPFIFPHPVSRELGVDILTDWLIAVIDLIVGMVLDYGNVDESSILRIPNKGDWVIMGDRDDSVIDSLFLGEALVPSEEYMVLPIHAINISRDDLRIAIDLAHFESLAHVPWAVDSIIEPPKHLPPLLPASTDSTENYTVVQSLDGSGIIVREEIVQLHVTWVNNYYSEILDVFSTFTIGLIISICNVPRNTRLVEVAGERRTFTWDSQETVAEVGWSGNGVIRVYLVVPPWQGAGLEEIRLNCM